MMLQTDGADAVMLSQKLQLKLSGSSNPKNDTDY
jgi:hypothetical protein